MKGYDRFVSTQIKRIGGVIYDESDFIDVVDFFEKKGLLDPHPQVTEEKNEQRKIDLENDQGHFVEVLVFATKKDLLASIDREYDEEIRRVRVIKE